MKCNNDCFNCQFDDCIIQVSEIREGRRGRPKKYLTEAERRAARVKSTQRWLENNRNKKRAYDREYYHKIRKPKESAKRDGESDK